jgi:hypothetical protein
MAATDAMNCEPVTEPAGRDGICRGCGRDVTVAARRCGKTLDVKRRTTAQKNNHDERRMGCIL